MSQIFKVKILKDENGTDFVPFTTSESVFIPGTNDTVQDALDEKQDTLTAGVGIEIDENNVISNTGSAPTWGNITGNLEDQADLKEALDIIKNITVEGTTLIIGGD